MPVAYYNEIDPYAAEWLRNLIRAGYIAAGDVDTRSIVDVKPDDLLGYTQCHFFAGIGGWSYALRLAGWPDDRPVWTGSCPCQPFSAAGKGEAFDDPRHLWPAWSSLIGERRPSVIFGEQVASSYINPWLDLIQADLETMEYAFGGVAFPAASIGAPHIRDRLYWVADSTSQRQQRRRTSQEGDGCESAWIEPQRLCDAGGMGNTDHSRLEGYRGGHQAEGGRIRTLRPTTETGESGGLANPSGIRQHGMRKGPGSQTERPCWQGDSWAQRRPLIEPERSSSHDRMADAHGRQLDGLAVVRGPERDWKDAGRAEGCCGASACGDPGRVADAEGQGLPHGGARQVQPLVAEGCGNPAIRLADTHSNGRDQTGQRQSPPRDDGSFGDGSDVTGKPSTRPTNGVWGTADWLYCRDGKWRPVEPGAQQMVDGISRAMGLLCTDDKAQEEVSNATKAIGLTEQVVRSLRRGYGEEAIWRSLGGCIGFPEATLLLAAVCQHQRELGRIFLSPTPRGAQERENALRALWGGTSEASCAPQGWEYSEQPVWQLGDIVSELSQINSPVIWIMNELHQFTGSPLARNVPSRVGRLRAYGNAIIPEQAAAFIIAAQPTFQLRRVRA